VIGVDVGPFIRQRRQESGGDVHAVPIRALQDRLKAQGGLQDPELIHPVAEMAVEG
jgi:hypothetical protein